MMDVEMKRAATRLRLLAVCGALTGAAWGAGWYAVHVYYPMGLGWAVGLCLATPAYMLAITVAYHATDGWAAQLVLTVVIAVLYTAGFSEESRAQAQAEHAAQKEKERMLECAAVAATLETDHRYIKGKCYLREWRSHE